MKTGARTGRGPTPEPNRIARFYRLVYGILLTGSGLYILFLLRGAGGTTINLLAIWLLLTGGIMLSPAPFRGRLVPAFLRGSQGAALALWLSLPFIALGSFLLLSRQETELALGGIAIGLLLFAAAFILRTRAAVGRIP